MPKLAIRQQIMVLAILPFLLVAGGTGLFLLKSYLTEVHHLDETLAERSARLLARHAAAALRQGDSEGLDDLLASSFDRQTVGAGLLDMDGNWLGQRGAPIKPNLSLPFERGSPVWHEQQLTAYWPVYRYDHTDLSPTSGTEPAQLGWAVITSSHNHFLQARYGVIALSLVWLLLSLLLVVYLGGRLTRNFDNSIKQTHQLLSNLDQHDWSTRLPHSKNRDWQLLFSAINELAHRTQQHLRQLKNEVEHSNQDLQRTLESLEISNMELALAREEALSASQSKSEFLANTSHEVRTPLTGILGFCNVLLQSETNPRRREYIDTIKHSAEHLLRVLNDILDLSKIEAGKFSLQYQPFDLLPVIEESASLFSQQAADKGIELIVDAEEPLPLRVMGDSARLKQLLTNLISNAVKFTDAGQVLIHLRAEETESGLISLSVIDTGIGISSPEQSKLFQAFQQLDGTDTRQHGGTGLGLAVVKRLTDLMGGSIQVNSELGRGAHFEVRLPLTPETTKALPVEAKGITVHIWEENPDARRALRRRLRAHAYEVESHGQLEELLAITGSGNTLIAGFASQHSFSAAEAQLTAHPDVIILLPSLAGVLARQDHVFLQKPLSERKLLEALQGRDERAGPQPAPTSSVLVVDDNDSNRLLLSALLEELGTNGTLCASGREAVALCEHQSYPLIILDLQMPDMNGTETARAIRQCALNKNSYLVALSAHLPDESESAALALFDRVLLKPMTLTTLAQLLQAHSDGEAVVSQALCIERANHQPELAKVLLKRFLFSLEATREEWKSAVSERDSEAVRSLTHQLLGACRYVGVPALELQMETIQSEINEGLTSQVWKTAEESLKAMDALLAWHAEETADSTSLA
ncbi:two-component system sensor histidine kinase BarA [Litorivivens lipolytica]|uniref:histidine kinase n=1 Tax=Litorivivens lipolytica TaxID=1524264 RepID=A0A7W4Z5I8_9GAMM|nr:ATP-binding protein [Litorivivens lipolytica]MBB3046006.1 two-component system sensor histidine kinase BarA [Litorivivens lipolytica]